MKTQTVKPEWNIKELEKFFTEIQLPPPPIKLNPDLQRLQQLKTWIENRK